MNYGVVLNYPNIIGWIRLILLLVAVPLENSYFLICYSISSGLDFFDGFCARFFQQSSILGSCLDMITDRISTVVISLRIIKQKPQHYFFISVYLIIDLLSHFIHFHTSALSNHHHKENKSLILRIYYNKYILFPICLLSECFFISCLLFKKNNLITNALYYVTLVKMFFHLEQLAVAISILSNIKCKTN